MYSRLIYIITSKHKISFYADDSLIYTYNDTILHMV